MSGNTVGIIVCVSIVICGMGAYFIGRCAGIEWAMTHIKVELDPIVKLYDRAMAENAKHILVGDSVKFREFKRFTEDDDDQGRSDQADG